MTIFDNQGAERRPAAGADRVRSHLIVLALACLLTCGAAPAQQQAASQTTITPAFRDADLAVIIEAVSQITGKTFLLDPRTQNVRVTILSSTPMSPDAFYQTFLSILQVHGFVAVPAGNVIKILPDANARQMPANDLPGSISSAPTRSSRR